MKLRRQKRKTSQALDAIASVTEIWSDWKPGKQVGKGVKKVKALRPPGKVKSALSSKRVRIGGAVAVAGGAGAAIFGKLRGKSDPPPVYTGPAPSVAADAAAKAPDAVAASLIVAPEPSGDNTTMPAAGVTALRNPPEAEKPEPAAGAAALYDAGAESKGDKAEPPATVADDATTAEAVSDAADAPESDGADAAPAEEAAPAEGDASPT
ncbi:MAG TPA: hypothetical protein VHZ31_05955 [Solirubrobacteraceae bacterium]|jgi:hypothetical protein|nr:hypothetical protein [Solirubrobacteraceae bacterium]